MSDLECALKHENYEDTSIASEDISITIEIVKDLHRQMF